MKFVDAVSFFKSWSTYGVLIMGFWPEIWSMVEQVSGAVQEAQTGGQGFTFALASKIVMILVLFSKAVKQKRDAQGRLTLAAAK